MDLGVSGFSGELAALVEARQALRVRKVRTAMAWAASLRRFARTAVWALPIGAVLLGVTGWLGGPDTPGPAHRWLAMALAALIFGLLGVVALTGLLATTNGRRFAVAALLCVLTGTILIAPVLGVIGLVGEKTAAGRAVLAGGAARTFGAAGLALLVLGWLALACAVAVSDVLNGTDAVLLVVGVAVAALAAALGRSFVLVIAAMLLLAAALGLAFTASRLTLAGDPMIEP